ncbi:MAG: amino acid permease, partial [Actinomycetales bacterium]
LGEETEKPGRDMPRGLIGTLAICTVLYALVCLVLTGMVNYTEISEGAPISNAFTVVGLDWANVLVNIAAIAGLTSVLLVEIVALGRIGFAVSRDGLIPKGVGEIHPRFHTPARFSIGVTIFIAVLAAVIPLDALAEMVSIGTLFALFVVAIAVIVLRRTRPKMKRPFRVPQVPIVPILAAVLCVALMTNLATETWLRFIVWFAAGILIYALYGFRHSKLRRRA